MSTSALPVDPFEFSQAGDFTDNFTYTVPASGEVQPYTATATFANSSGQAVQPTISMYSANGNLLARVFPVAALADGDSAEVTWMPPFGSAASSPSTGGFTALSEQATADDVTIAGGGNSSDFTWSHTSGATLLDYNTATNPRIISAGIYAVSFFIHDNANAPASATIEYMTLTIGVHGSGEVFIADDMPYSNIGLHLTSSRTLSVGALRQLKPNMANYSASAQTIHDAQLSITRLS